MNSTPQKEADGRIVDRRRLWIYLLVFVVLLLGFSVSTVVRILRSIHNGQEAIRIEADKGFEKAKASIKPEKLRSWALQAVNRWPGLGVMGTPIPLAEIPDSICQLYTNPAVAEANPPTADAYTNKAGDYVVITWGGGFAHWRYYVGTTNFWLSTNDGYVFKWAEGIYYSRDFR